MTTFDIESVCSEIAQYYATRQYEQIAPMLRNAALSFIRSHNDIEMGLRNLRGWKRGIVFRLQRQDAKKYSDIEKYVMEGTKLIANDL